jgi:uncharacterized membrane protein
MTVLDPITVQHFARSEETSVSAAERRLCWLAILFGVFLRVNHFWKSSLWLDELSAVWVATADGWSTLWQRCLMAHQPPAYYAVLRTFLAFGHNEFLSRLPTMIFGLASIGALMATMEMATRGRVSGSRAALYAGAIYALNSRAIFHGQEARMYAMVLFLSIVSLYFFIASLDSGGRWNLAIYAISTLLVLYTHLIYSAVLFGQIAVAVLFYCFSKRRPPSLRAVLATQIGLLFSLTPLTKLFLSVAGHSRAGMDSFIRPPNLRYWISLSQDPEFGLAALLILLSIPWLRAQRWRLRDLNDREKALLALGLSYVAIFPAAAVLAGVGVVNILEPRYLLLPMLGAILVAGFVAAKADDRRIRRSLCVYVAVQAFLQLIIACYVGPWVNTQYQDWRGAIAWVQGQYQPGDVVLLRSGLIEAKYLSLDDAGAPKYLSLPLCGFYDRGGMTVFNLPWTTDQLQSSRLTPAAVRERVHGARKVFFLMAPLLSGTWDWTLQEKWIRGPGPPPEQLERRKFLSLEVRVYRLPAHPARAEQGD